MQSNRVSTQRISALLAALLVLPLAASEARADGHHGGGGHAAASGGGHGGGGAVSHAAAPAVHAAYAYHGAPAGFRSAPAYAGGYGPSAGAVHVTPAVYGGAVSTYHGSNAGYGGVSVYHGAGAGSAVSVYHGDSAQHWTSITPRGQGDVSFVRTAAQTGGNPHGGGGPGGGPHGGNGWHGGGEGFARPAYASNAGYVVHHGGGSYWYHGGYWYRPWGGTWVIAGAPYGAFVPWLPWGYTSLWIGGAPYYYYNQVYYVYRDDSRGYEVVPPPEGAPAQVAQNDTLFAYPKDGQSAEQQASDRYDCHKWALEQTGYDPTQSGGGVPSEEAGQRRADYQRAMTSCLEGRGYSVR